MSKAVTDTRQDSKMILLSSIMQGVEQPIILAIGKNLPISADNVLISSAE